MKSILLILFMAFLSGHSPSTATINITGSVYDQQGKVPLSGVSVTIKGTTTGTLTNINGWFSITVPKVTTALVFNFVGYATKEVVVGNKKNLNVYLSKDTQPLEEEVEVALDVEYKKAIHGKSPGIRSRHSMAAGQTQSVGYAEAYPQFNTEEYASINENIFHDPARKPLSTFSIDVDAASYSNVRRFLRQGQIPPKDAVRIEEMVNYFTYDYDQPSGARPFSVHTELSIAPWNNQHQLLHIGLQGRRIPMDNLPPSNLVFLIDVSGSMDSPNKLGLLKSAFKLLTNQLRAQDKVSMVVYAGAAGVVLSPTPGNQKQTILEALGKLRAGGSTAGGEGIKLAYNIAQEQFVDGGNNRVILATDGDFNIGASSNAEMERLIQKKRENGVFLTVLGFGMGNYKDSKMEVLADKGNGNYAYIDNILEAKKVLVSEFGGTLFTIAKDVKLQLEFNPAQVKAYRLVGYENRMLRDEDFNNDKKDAGELGSGHTVTALYEIIPANSESGAEFINDIDPLKYQDQKAPSSVNNSNELMTLKLRYKQPEGTKSQLITTVVGSNPMALTETSNDFRWSAAVASFGMLLRESEFKGSATYTSVENWAVNAQGADRQGYRQEFIKLVQSVDLLVQR